VEQGLAPADVAKAQHVSELAVASGLSLKDAAAAWSKNLDISSGVTAALSKTREEAVAAQSTADVVLSAAEAAGLDTATVVPTWCKNLDMSAAVTAALSKSCKDEGAPTVTAASVVAAGKAAGLDTATAVPAWCKNLDMSAAVTAALSKSCKDEGASTTTADTTAVDFVPEVEGDYILVTERMWNYQAIKHTTEEAARAHGSKLWSAWIVYAKKGHEYNELAVGGLVTLGRPHASIRKYVQKNLSSLARMSRRPSVTTKG